MHHASKRLAFTFFFAHFSPVSLRLLCKMNIETKETEGEAAASHISFASDKTQFYKPNYTF